MSAFYCIHLPPSLNFTVHAIDSFAEGGKLSKHAQVCMVSNSICPPIAAALFRAKLVEQQQQEVAA